MQCNAMMCLNNLTSLEVMKRLPNESYSSNWVREGKGDGEHARSKQEHVNCKHTTHQHVYSTNGTK